MQPKLIPTELWEYEAAEFVSETAAGFLPLGDKVIILPDTSPETTAGGIVVPDEMRERMSMAAESGIVIAVGADAFVWNSDRTRRLEGTEKPQPGDRVFFERYSGGVCKGRDGKMYRLCEDKCIAGIAIEEEGADETRTESNG